jgi:hypothetical protein
MLYEKKISKTNAKIAVVGTTQIMDAIQNNNSLNSDLFIGGNGLLSAIAISKYNSVSLFSVVGDDINLSLLKKSLPESLDIKNVTQLKGDTFYWKVNYDETSENITSQEIDFGVHARFSDELFSVNEFGNLRHIHFSGTDPEVCLKILKKIKKSNDNFNVSVDTLMFYINSKPKETIELATQAQIIFTSEKEKTELDKLMSASLFLESNSLEYIFNTRGSNGIELINREFSQNFSTKPVNNPLLSTNAGDVFAGSVIGQIYLDVNWRLRLKNIIKQAQTDAKKVILNDQFYRINYETDKYNTR